MVQPRQNTVPATTGRASSQALITGDYSYSYNGATYSQEVTVSSGGRVTATLVQTSTDTSGVLRCPTSMTKSAEYCAFGDGGVPTPLTLTTSTRTISYSLNLNATFVAPIVLVDYIAESSKSASDTSNTSSGMTLGTGAKAGIGAGIAVAIIGIALALFLLLRRRRNRYRFSTTEISGVVYEKVKSHSDDHTESKPELSSGEAVHRVTTSVKPELDSRTLTTAESAEVFELSSRPTMRHEADSLPA